MHRPRGGAAAPRPCVDRNDLAPAPHSPSPCVRRGAKIAVWRRDDPRAWPSLLALGAFTVGHGHTDRRIAKGQYVTICQGPRHAFLLARPATRQEGARGLRPQCAPPHAATRHLRPPRARPGWWGWAHLELRRRASPSSTEKATGTGHCPWGEGVASVCGAVAIDGRLVAYHGLEFEPQRKQKAPKARVLARCHVGEFENHQIPFSQELTLRPSTDFLQVESWPHYLRTVSLRK